MGARRGAAVLERLRKYSPEIWHHGERVSDVTQAAGLSNGVRGLASLYDYQWTHADRMLVQDPSTGSSVSRTFAIPRSLDELKSLGDAMCCAADHSKGMMGREPAYMNRVLSTLAGGSAYLESQGTAYGENIRRYHAYIKENDLSSTHTIINPRPSRLDGPGRSQNAKLGAHVTRERDDGIVVNGARLLATLPIADEIAVMPSRLLNTEDAKDYAFFFSIPTATPGLKFLCRDSVDYGATNFDHPFGSRFEEQDAVVLFKDVFVPWERVFCYRDLDVCENVDVETNLLEHMTYQVVCKAITKTEYLLGLASLMVEGSGLDGFQHVHEKIAEIWVNLQTVKAFKHASEAEARLNAYGVMVPGWEPLNAARNLYPRLYPRMVEIIQQIGASGLVALPTEADLNGPLREEIDTYYQAARMSAAERIPLYRLAWDTAVSSFAGRQVLYERFFFGDPVQNASAVFRSVDRSGYMAKVKQFLENGTGEGA